MSRWAYWLLLLLPTIALAGIVTHGARLYVASGSESSCEGAVDGFQPEEGFCLIGTSIGHGERVTLTLEGGGFGSGPSKVLDDRVSNISAYSSLGEGDRIPTAGDAPWSGNTPLGDGEVQFSQLNLRHARQTANYKFSGAGTLEFPKALGGSDPPDGQDAIYGRVWLRRNTTGTGGGNQSSKVFRGWDDGDGTGTRISWGTENMTIFRGSPFMDEGAWPAVEMPAVGNWKLFEIFIDSGNGAIRAYQNGAAGASFDGSFKDSNFTNVGMNFKIVGFDIGGADPLFASWQMSDIYVADSRARVLIVDEADFGDVATGQEIQVCKSWANGSITFYLNLGQFSTLSGKHLYVITAADEKLYVGQFE